MVEDLQKQGPIKVTLRQSSQGHVTVVDFENEQSLCLLVDSAVVGTAPDYLKNMLYPVSERASQRALRSATNNDMVEQRHGRATLSAQVRRTCIQHRRPESVDQYSCRSVRHTEHCYVQKEPENIFIP